MAVNASGRTANELYSEIAWKLKVSAIAEDSRNGEVRTLPFPFTARLINPMSRVLLAPIRRPNHVFHVMEAIWMLAGENNVLWLAQFNSGITQYTENNIMHGAYGHRWRTHFGLDQLTEIAGRLKTEPTTRQAVLTMWDPFWDLPASVFKDRPCNTQIFFRIVGYRLDMHVINRSNDFLWGMLGSNIVHMTILQELMARWVNCDVGHYYVTTNNLHVYAEYPNFHEVMFEAMTLDNEFYSVLPLIQDGETVPEFLIDCKNFVDGRIDMKCRWFHDVAAPMMHWYLDRRKRDTLINLVKADDWRAGLRQFQGEF